MVGAMQSCLWGISVAPEIPSHLEGGLVLVPVTDILFFLSDWSLCFW